MFTNYKQVLPSSFVLCTVGVQREFCLTTLLQLQLDQSNLMMSGYPSSFVEGFHDASSVAQMNYRQIGKTDMTVSTLSFGASSLGGVFRTTNDDESAKLVENAVKQGINYILTLPLGMARADLKLFWEKPPKIFLERHFTLPLKLAGMNWRLERCLIFQETE